MKYFFLLLTCLQYKITQITLKLLMGNYLLLLFIYIKHFIKLFALNFDIFYLKLNKNE